MTTRLEESDFMTQFLFEFIQKFKNKLDLKRVSGRRSSGISVIQTNKIDVFQMTHPNIIKMTQLSNFLTPWLRSPRLYGSKILYKNTRGNIYSQDRGQRGGYLRSFQVIPNDIILIRSFHKLSRITFKTRHLLRILFKLQGLLTCNSMQIKGNSEQMFSA